MFPLHCQLRSIDCWTFSVLDSKLWPMSRTGLDFISFYPVEYLTQAPTEKMLLSSSDLLHQSGLSKAWIIYIGTKVVCTFCENMQLFLTSFRRRDQNTRSEDWYPYSTCNQSTHFLGWLLTCFMLGKIPQHFYESQRYMVHGILQLSTSSVMWGEAFEVCSPGKSCVHYDTWDRKSFIFTPKSYEVL